MTTRQRQPDVLEMLRVVRSHLLEFLLERAHAVDAVHELEVTERLVMEAGQVDDAAPYRLVDAS